MKLSALMLALLFASLVAMPAASQPKLFRVAGKVVSQSDGHPLPQASLKLLSIPERKLLQSTTSSADGSFAFADVPAGKFELQGEAPGFVLTTYDQHSGFSTAIVTGSSVSADSLTFQLVPKAVLSGTVSDTSGEPVSPANVYLFRQAEDFGEGPVVPAGNATTNDIGQYEFPNLPAGSYLLEVQAQPWYATNPFVTEAAGTVGVSGPVDPMVQVAYPITYYPGVTDPLQATPIVLHAGDTVADLRLGSVPALQLTFRNVMQTRRNPRDGTEMPTSPRVPQLEVDVFGMRQFVPTLMQTTGTDVVLGGIAPGDYLLLTNNSGQTSRPEKINISHNSMGELPSEQNLMHLRFTVRLPDGSPVPRGTRLALSSPQDRVDRAGSATNANGEADLTVGPGDYVLQIASTGRSPGTMFVRQVLAGETAVPSNPLHISAGRDSAATPAAYTVYAAPGNITVDGFAQKNGTPFAGAFILLVRADELHGPRNWRTQQSDLDGSFDLTNVAPGKYLLFAIEYGWQLKWREDSVLTRYAPGAEQIEIVDNPKHSQHLEQPVAVQPKL